MTTASVDIIPCSRREFMLARLRALIAVFGRPGGGGGPVSTRQRIRHPGKRHRPTRTSRCHDRRRPVVGAPGDVQQAREHPARSRHRPGGAESRWPTKAAAIRDENKFPPVTQPHSWIWSGSVTATMVASCGHNRHALTSWFFRFDGAGRTKAGEGRAPASTLHGFRRIRGSIAGRCRGYPRAPCSFSAHPTPTGRVADRARLRPGVRGKVGARGTPRGRNVSNGCVRGHNSSGRVGPSARGQAGLGDFGGPGPGIACSARRARHHEPLPPARSTRLGPSQRGVAPG